MRKKDMQNNISKMRKELILQFIKNFMEINGYSPSIRDICKGVNITSTSVVKKFLDILEKEGEIEKRQTVARGIKIKNEIPILGKIKAGVPVISEEHIEGYVNVDKILKYQNSFFLKVEGSSMINAGINDGDLALIKMQKALENNDIGVFRINSEVTLKRLKMENNTVRLKAENPEYSDIEITEKDDFQIIGKLVYLLRDYETN
jgi:repressor LexA